MWFLQIWFGDDESLDYIGLNYGFFQGLLQFALNTTRNEDAPDPSAFHQIDPERRQFLGKSK